MHPAQFAHLGRGRPGERLLAVVVGAGGHRWLVLCLLRLGLRLQLLCLRLRVGGGSVRLTVGLLCLRLLLCVRLLALGRVLLWLRLGWVCGRVARWSVRRMGLRGGPLSGRLRGVSRLRLMLRGVVGLGRLSSGLGVGLHGLGRPLLRLLHGARCLLLWLLRWSIRGIA
jgi:hypothetical protein